MKTIQKMLSVLLTGAMLTTTVPRLFILQDIDANAAFEQSAADVVQDITLGWNLGNTLDAYSGTEIKNEGLGSETAWGNLATTQAMINMVHDTGIDLIRVPVTWYNHMDASTYQIDSAWMARVKETVDYVLADNMYCILNVHHDTGENGWLKANSTNLDNKKKMFTAIWKQISAEFKDYGDKLLFEGFNEILDESANQWYNPSTEAVPITNDLNQIFVDTVRKSGGNNDKRVLICNTYCAGANKEITSGFRLPSDTVSNKLIVETHIYQPFPFTSEGYPDVTTWDSTSLNQYVDNIYGQFVQNGTPVIIGEFGCANKNNMDQITSWANYYVEYCKARGIKCIWWDNGAQYKIFNRRTLKVSEENLLNTMLAAANGEEYAADTTVYGDADGNGKLESADVTALLNFLLTKSGTCDTSADMNKDGKLNAIDLTLLKRSLLSAENMTADIDNWTSWVDTAAGANGEMTYTDNGVKMQVNAGGEEEWNAQVMYEGITLEQGATYKISFDYKADSAQSTTFHVMQGHGDYLPYYSGELDWTTSAQHFEDTFEYTKATDKVCRVGFNLGGSGVNVPFCVEIANLSLVKVSGGTSSSGTTDTEPATPTATGENLTADAANWSSWVYEDGSAATVTKLTNGIEIAVTQSGEEEWYIQGSYPDITLEKGAQYQIEFDYSADKDISLMYHVQQNYDPYGQYKYETIDYTTAKQHYTGTFSMTEPTDDNVVIVFSAGGADLSTPFTITVTDLILKKIG